VEKLWTIGAFPVHRATRKIYFAGATLGNRSRLRLCTGFRGSLRLISV